MRNSQTHAEHENARNLASEGKYQNSSNNDSMHPRGGQRRESTPLECVQVDSQCGMYMERQILRFCQLHALNALFGRNVVQPKDMMKFVASELRRDTALGRLLGHPRSNPHVGDYPDMAVDALLHHICQPAARLMCLRHGIPLGSKEGDFTALLPADMDAFIVRWNKGNMPHESTT